MYSNINENSRDTWHWTTFRYVLSVTEKQPAGNLNVGGKQSTSNWFSRFFLSHTPPPAVCYPKVTKVTTYQKYALQYNPKCLIKLLRTAILMFRINVCYEKVSQDICYNTIAIYKRPETDKKKHQCEAKHSINLYNSAIFNYMWHSGALVFMYSLVLFHTTIQRKTAP